jgi:hypothetical protein
LALIALFLLENSAHKPALGSVADLGPVTSSSAQAGVDVLLAAMPPPKPITGWLGGFGMKKKVAK